MSDVDGMFGRSENGALVAVVQIHGKLNKAQFDELLDAVKAIQAKYPSLQLEVRTPN